VPKGLTVEEPKKKPGRWKPGESGNPKGRPPKKRALTVILERKGAVIKKGPGEERGKSRKNILAEQVWQLATEGKTTLHGGMELKIEDAKEWAALVAWLYKHVDGPGRYEVEANAGVTFVWDIPVPPNEI
jgi:hypothetical protein